MKTVKVGEGKSGFADGGKGGGMCDLLSDVDFLAGVRIIVLSFFF